MKRWLALGLALLAAGCTSGLKRPVEEITAKAGADGVQHVRIVAHSFYFSPNRVVVKAGTPVELTVKNAAFGVPHNLTCFEKDAGIELSENLGMFRGQKHVRFTAATPGEYEFYCHVGSHAKKGMKGTLVVVE
ncbi:MAG TPA: cupredoxin domain-containing protein [Candidatus Eisenbacteria bacterium]|jgi:plastocyanin